MGAEHNELLRTMQKLVISSMKNKSDMDVKAKLNERLKELKVFLLGSAAIELQSSKEDDMQTSKDDGELIELKS
ncbi:unnamed protein product [Anisakis simplex]|uniref:Uncharacterized protein n=1 Tax=Anisakis simplex TaxID=6269 RepID=A0A3P6SGU7_ANISI|nr:unnamed protein product [Anisakis simplex]